MIFRYVRIPDVEAWLQLGWRPLPALDGTHHGCWSVMLDWICPCPPVEPKRGEGA